MFSLNPNSKGFQILFFESLTYSIAHDTQNLFKLHNAYFMNKRTKIQFFVNTFTVVVWPSLIQFNKSYLCVNIAVYLLLQYTGDFSFAIGAVSVLINECQDVIIENMTVNTNETSNVTKPPMPPALEEVLQLLCPNDCTFNGKCVNGSCVCNKDYTADDCSISMYQRPTITRWDSNNIP